MGRACPRTYALESSNLSSRRSRSGKAPDLGYGSLTRSFASMAEPSIASIFLRAAPDSSCASLDATGQASNSIGRTRIDPAEGSSIIVLNARRSHESISVNRENLLESLQVFAKPRSHSAREEAAPHEGPRARERAAAVLQMGVPERPGVDHVRPYLQCDARVSLAEPRRETRGIG